MNLTQSQHKNWYSWMWVPTLYFAEGIPYFLVNNISVAMFTKMGVANDSMAFFTSLIYLPWVIKPFWAPFVDIIKTKRWWIVMMELIMTITMILTLVSIPHPSMEMMATMTTPVKLFYAVLVWFVIMAFASATHDIAADGFYMLALTPGQQAEMIGWRSVFYRLSNVFCNSALVAIPGIVVTQGYSMTLGWQVAMGISAVLYAVVTIWHFFFAPKPASDKPSTAITAREIAKDFGQAFATYFTKPGIWLGIAFMLLYRLPEAFLMKMVAPFLLGAREFVNPETGLVDMAQSGLGLSLERYGVVYGVVGVIFLLLGGILGGSFIAKRGLRGSIWWMALSMTLPCLSFVYLSVFRPDSELLISIAVAIEQFGYGFGFTAYMMYMVFMSEGEFKTAHYALCSGFMALSMMLPGMIAGKLQLMLGYVNFFWMVIICCVFTIAVTFFVSKKLPEEYGKKES